MKSSKPSIKYDKFKEIVYDKQVNSYGVVSADKNLKTAVEILLSTLIQKNDDTKKNNTLLVGKVQSGKTSNLEMLTALAFDNDFNLMIIYGGYDKTLLKQCVDRFSETFNSDSENDDMPYVFNTNQNLSFLDNSFLENAIEEGRPIIIASMKRPKALNDVNECLGKLNPDILKAFIIDDEGDQASLNTKKNSFGIDPETGEPFGSATYKAICKMKEILKDPLYFAVTATPEANIFQPEISELIPETVHLIQPANLYTGADVFHLNTDDNIKVIPEVDTDSVEQGILIDSLKNAIEYYIISSAIMKDKGINSSDMIIHVYREIEGHQQLVSLIDSYLENIEDTFKNGIKDDIEFQFSEMKKIYTNEYFNQNILDEYPWDTHLENLIKLVVKKKIKSVMQNSEGDLDPNILRHFKYKIFIGGDLLQRGITFKHLVTTYFTRWAKKGNMDTNLQRARWFGYRNDYIDLCKVFTTQTIKTEFSSLATIENDLWNQFALAEKGEIQLSDIVIDADETSLNPTRGNVATYKKTKFGKLWNNQMYCTFDKNQINKNNALLESLMVSCNSIPTTAGRLDRNVSAYYSMIDTDTFVDFVNNSIYIFDQPPFNNRSSLVSAISEYDEVCVEFMFGEGLNSERHRSFNGNRILALQQGADTVDVNKQKYKGDAYVIAKNDKPCVQVFCIVPEFDDTAHLDLKQYMYSIHFPVKHSVFVKK